MEGVLNMSEQNLKQVLAKKQSILQGDAERIAKQRAAGKLTARERARLPTQIIIVTVGCVSALPPRQPQINLHRSRLIRIFTHLLPHTS